MPLYRVNESNQFIPFAETPFPDLEKVLEDWIEANPHVLFQDETIAFISRQPRTIHGKFLDLLGVDESGACVVVELKRGETPRDVVAQALEYASWVDSLTRDQIDEMAHEYAIAKGIEASNVADLYRRAFSPSREKEEQDTEAVTDHITFNNRQRLVIVAERFSGEIEQSIRYLRTRLGVDITGLQFGVHKAGSDMIIQTNTVVGREITAIAAAKSNEGQASGVTRSEIDESILAKAKTDFVRSAVTSIEQWVNDIGNPDLLIRHGPGSDHFIRLRGRTQVYYYYAQNWIYCSLYNATSAELHDLQLKLSKPDQVIENPPGYVRFHLANESDLEVMKQVIRGRIGASPIA
ncbi:MAG: hypothetical protein ACYDAR_01820 [Thermomicrobiales bacterium]